MSDVVIAGVGMTRWGKLSRDFVEYGVEAATEALDDAGVDWRDVQFVAAGGTVRNGYAGYVAGSSIAQALGWSGAQLATAYGACASGTMAIDVARTRILAGLCDVALVVGADTTPKGFLAPNAGDRPNDPDWLRFRLLGAANPAYFAFMARRRIDMYGATAADFAAVKVKNARHGRTNPRARYRKETTVEEVLASPIVADPLHLLDICATSDGGAALVLVSEAKARQLAGAAPAVRIRGVASVTPTYPNIVLELPNISTDSSLVVPAPQRSYMDSIADAAYGQAGIGPDDVDVAEVYDLATAIELDWYEHLGFCATGTAEKLLRDGDTSIGGRIPVNPSGGLACFGEAVPAQAIAQVCEITWQLQGRATGRQVEGARVGVTANKGLFGHGSAVVVST